MSLLKEQVLRHPGSEVDNYLYPSRADSVVSLAEVVNQPGAYRDSANSLQFGGVSGFSISSSKFIHGLQLTATLTLPANNVISTAGWLFSLLDRIEIVFPNSTTSNITCSGEIFYNYLLSTCKDQNQREQLIRNAGMPAAAGSVAIASIPLWWVLGSANGLGSNYPIDMSTLRGPIQINLTWKSSAVIICRTGAAPTTISSFTSLTLTGVVTELEDSRLSIRPFLASGEYDYVLHGKGLKTLYYPFTFAQGAQQSINLSNSPNNPIDYIILSIRSEAEFSPNADGTSNYLGSVQISQLQLNQGSTILFQANTQAEYLAHLRHAFNGDDMMYRYAWDSANSSAAAAQDLIETQLIIIPFNLYGKQVASGKLVENMRSYSNEALQLTFTTKARSQYDGSASPFYATAINPRGGSGSQAYTLHIGYVYSSMLDISMDSLRVV